MRCSCLDGAQLDCISHDLIWRRENDIANIGAKLSEDAASIFCGSHHVLVSACGDQLAIDADSHVANIAFDTGKIIVRIVLKRSWIGGAGASDYAKYGRSVCRTACHWSDMIHRFGKCEYSSAAHSSPGRLETRYAVHGRRKADRA